ncbi:serine hydrolase [Winogradskyella sp. MIT101101]|uniref:serine hydrolase n=1 Tax=Winogradskyella sp. MIT101101 TaxID=3098297 RepID=UPI00399B687D
MNRITITLLLILTITISVSCHHNKNVLKKSDPTAKGFSQAKLDALSTYLENTGSEAMMVLTDGKIVYDWGNTDKKLLVHSIRKALLNSLYGIYIENGTIDTTKTIGQLKIDDINPLTETEKTATIADLLKSRSGIYHHAAAVSEGMLAAMPQRGTHKPNEAYYYNNWDFNTLGYILEQQTGKNDF